MRPAPFDFQRAESLDHALALLRDLGEDARPLAGGYSLVPMMNLRLARPQHLIDINGLDLHGVETEGDVVRLGGLLRHARLVEDPVVAQTLPLFREAAHAIAHPTIRQRGTLGGSLAHADPTAELALLALLHEAVIVAASHRGERRIRSRDFFLDALTTALEPDEIVVALEVPRPPKSGAFLELAERHGDYAIVAVGVLIDGADGRITEARIACAGATFTPVRGGDAEALLVGRALDEPRPRDAARALAEAHEPLEDLRATAAFRRHLIEELTTRAIEEACARARA